MDDDRAMIGVLTRQLGASGFSVEGATSGAEALDCLARRDFDVLLTDLRMRGMDGMELCRHALAIRPGLRVIVVTAFGSMETAIEAIRAGAYDFLTKPYDMRAVHLALDRAVAYSRVCDELRRLRAENTSRPGHGELVGQSVAMARVRELVDRLADSDVTVLIRGESGTGKELVARALHQQGRRSEGPFVAVNCGALPEQLLESELFGHVRGAFTDARAARPGLMVTAHGGTLLLDEIGDMPFGMQVKLLRAIEDRRVRPVGGDSDVPWDARVLAASHHDLERAVKEGRFRQDLFFRLNVVEFELPSLRARADDILLLAQHFLDRAGPDRRVRSLAPEAAQRMLVYGWPGNVRELRNCIDRAIALGRFDQVTVEDLPDRIAKPITDKSAEEALLPEQFVTLDVLEKMYVARVLRSVGDHRATAAQILGIDRKTLYRKLLE